MHYLHERFFHYNALNCILRDHPCVHMKKYHSSQAFYCNTKNNINKNTRTNDLKRFSSWSQSNMQKFQVCQRSIHLCGNVFPRVLVNDRNVNLSGQSINYWNHQIKMRTAKTLYSQISCNNSADWFNNLTNCQLYELWPQTLIFCKKRKTACRRNVCLMNYSSAIKSGFYYLGIYYWTMRQRTGNYLSYT